MQILFCWRIKRLQWKIIQDGTVGGNNSVHSHVNVNTCPDQIWALVLFCLGNLYLLDKVLNNIHTNAVPTDVYKHTYILTYLLTPWCRVLLEKLTGLQLVKKFPAFHGTPKFIIALTSISHLSLSWASPIQSIYPHPTSWRSVLVSSTHLRLGLPSGLFPSGFPTKILYTPLPSPIRATCPAHLILLIYTSILKLIMNNFNILVCWLIFLCMQILWNIQTLQMPKRQRLYTPAYIN